MLRSGRDTPDISYFGPEVRRSLCDAILPDLCATACPVARFPLGFKPWGYIGVLGWPDRVSGYQYASAAAKSQFEEGMSFLAQLVESCVP